MTEGGSAAGRRAFITERRRSSVYRFDTLHSPGYDENWGAISRSHAAFVARLTGLVRPGGEVLDAACGTGKYWPALLAAGLRVTGVDQSAGMLTQARRKHPDVPARVLALQDIAGAADLAGRFDGLLCVDALEYVPPEDWPGTVAGLAAVMKPRTPAYVTVEVPDGPLPPPADPRQVAGEHFEGASTAATTTIRLVIRHAHGWKPPGSASKARLRPTATGTSSPNAGDLPARGWPAAQVAVGCASKM